ncbi:MAG TPA: DmsE family decaheme c-type cytochrome [Candidatus Acidoferrum sp.]|nr:DmsE family decaheme c-type cytochrome [Candidatus Acidoferrum sp.]
MGVQRQRPRIVYLIGLVLFFVAAVVSFAGQPKEKTPKKAQDQDQKTYVRPTDPNLYVGAETCKTCHEDMPVKGFFKTFEDSPHYVTTLDKKKGPEWHGCEACHGPGKAHVEGGGDVSKIFTFKKASAKEISERCLGCHQYGEEHSNFARSIHLQNGVSCIDCHDPHHGDQSNHLLKASQPELCYGCHLDKKQEFNRPFHHKVNEKLVKCTDCHNPHGGFASHQLRATASEDQVCFTCHADKAGPFVFQHEAVSIEGCTACHMPHGSSNPRLLKRAQVNLLCLECHAFAADAGAPATPTFHNQAQKYQACTMCHMSIHGSNSSQFLFTP